MNALWSALAGVFAKVIKDLIVYLLERPKYTVEMTHADLPVAPAKDIVKKYEDLLRRTP